MDGHGHMHCISINMPFANTSIIPPFIPIKAVYKCVFCQRENWPFWPSLQPHSIQWQLQIFDLGEGHFFEAIPLTLFSSCYSQSSANFESFGPNLCSLNCSISVNRSQAKISMGLWPSPCSPVLNAEPATNRLLY
jgi:hypothetical protein